MRVMFGFPLGLQAERVREVPQEQQERSWLYFDNNNKVVLPHSLSFFFFIQLWHNVYCRSRLIHERSLLCFSFPPTLFFEEFDAQRNRRVEKKKNFGNRRPLSELDFGSLGRPQEVYFFLLAFVLYISGFRFFFF